MKIHKIDTEFENALYFGLLVGYVSGQISLEHGTDTQFIIKTTDSLMLYYADFKIKETQYIQYSFTLALTGSGYGGMDFAVGTRAGAVHIWKNLTGLADAFGTSDTKRQSSSIGD